VEDCKLGTGLSLTDYRFQQKWMCDIILFTEYPLFRGYVLSIIEQRYPSNFRDYTVFSLLSRFSIR
jgi:hypothetical protein